MEQLTLWGDTPGWQAEMQRMSSQMDSLRKGLFKRHAELEKSLKIANQEIERLKSLLGQTGQIVMEFD